MKYQKALQMLRVAEKRGYVAYHSGLVSDGNGDHDYGINIDGDGHGGRLCGCPKIFWTVESVNRLLGTNYVLPSEERG
jgi:hypothetical protein